MQAFRDIFTKGYVMFMMRGLAHTLEASVAVVACSVVFGAILAVCRNYEKKVLGKIAGFYIELFRNTPLLLWILVCIFTLKGTTALIRASFGLVLYTSAVMAEIIRGGLNSVDKGQTEAAASQGFNFPQTLLHIIFPQCFLRIVPSMMSQIITTIKDTSFFAQFGIIEFFFNTKTLFGVISRNTVITSAHIFILYGFMAMVYFVINFTLSVLARRIKVRTV
jgi:putative glutamine transport system permease protein